MPETLSSFSPWWGEFKIPVGQAARWQIGPLILYIQREFGEWRVARQAGSDPHDTTMDFEFPAQVGDLLTLDPVTRFPVSGKGEDIVSEVVLADRPVVAHPEKTLILPPGERVTAYVSSMTWLRIRFGEKDRQMLEEFPIFQPSDTWFGPSTLEGELCYATRAFFRLNVMNIPVAPYRAITAVTIDNRSSNPLPIKRLKLPVEHLSLYRSSDGRLWTQDVTFESSRGDDFAVVKLRDQPPGLATDATLLTPARARSSEINVIRAFASLFE